MSKYGSIVGRVSDSDEVTLSGKTYNGLQKGMEALERLEQVVAEIQAKRQPRKTSQFIFLRLTGFQVIGGEIARHEYSWVQVERNIAGNFAVPVFVGITSTVSGDDFAIPAIHPTENDHSGIEGRAPMHADPVDGAIVLGYIHDSTEGTQVITIVQGSTPHGPFAGKITAVQAGAETYDAEALHDSDLTISALAPLNRTFDPATINLNLAAVGSVCTLIYDAPGNLKLWDTQETWGTTPACT